MKLKQKYFNNIEFSYNPTRHHCNSVGLSSVGYEKQIFEKLLSVQDTKRGVCHSFNVKKNNPPGQGNDRADYL